MTLTGKAKAIYKVTDTHVYGFFDKHRFLSNFHLHSIEYEDILYPSNENAYHAAKIFPGDLQPLLMKEADEITPREITRLDFASFTPNESKSKGRAISLRADWLQKLPNDQIIFDASGILIEQVRDKIMYDLNVIKFSNPYLLNLLLETGDRYLEETNWWRDDYWGVYHGPMGAQGLNKLGRILMKIRGDAKKKKEGK